MGTGESGDRFADQTHPSAEDLDLFGKGSLFEMLSTARTRKGEEELAGWLLAPAPISEIRARQAAVDELRGRLDLREDISLIGADVQSGVHADELSAWGSAPPVLTSRVMPLLAAAIGIFAMVAVVMWLGYGYRQMALGALICIMIFLARYRSQITQVIMAVDRPGRDLELLAEILARIEQEEFTSPRLVALRKALEADGLPPSRQIAQ
jgi:hypothetical protein